LSKRNAVISTEDKFPIIGEVKSWNPKAKVKAKVAAVKVGARDVDSRV